MISTRLRLRLRVTSLVHESASTEPYPPPPPPPHPRRHKPITNGMPLKRERVFLTSANTEIAVIRSTK